MLVRKLGDVPVGLPILGRFSRGQCNFVFHHDPRRFVSHSRCLGLVVCRLRWLRGFLLGLRF